MYKNKIKMIFRCFLIFVCIFWEAESRAEMLTLQNYLHQVCECNNSLAGSKLIARGAKQRIGEGKLLMRPALFAEGQYLKNSYDPDWSPIAGNRNTFQWYKMGVSETTPFGVEGKVYYNYQHQTITGISPFVNEQQFTASSPIVELNVPLARNFAGKETRANALLIDSQARLTHFSERYKMQMLIAQAEAAYWRLAALRSIVAKQEDSLSRAEKIQQWVKERTRLRLAEEADLLQAEAAVDAKKLDIQSAINDARIAELNFNTLRGSSDLHVCEHLTSFEHHPPCSMLLPTQPLLRDDIRAAEQQQKIAIAAAKLGIEKNKPNLDLYASYALNGNNPSSNEAISESFTTNYPSTAVGLRLSMPLDIHRINSDRAAYKKEIRGAKCQFQQKVFESYRLWDDLSLKLANAQKRLCFAKQLEQLQLKKLQVERQRLSFGKTTTYQVLLFEQDYANAQIASLAIQDEVLELIAQLKTFGG